MRVREREGRKGGVKLDIIHFVVASALRMYDNRLRPMKNVSFGDVYTCICGCNVHG